MPNNVSEISCKEAEMMFTSSGGLFVFLGLVAIVGGIFALFTGDVVYVIIGGAFSIIVGLILLAAAFMGFRDQTRGRGSDIGDDWVP